MASIILIGPMGAGKTTVGRQLARRLKRPFYDSDREIEAACGVDIPTIFDFEGEVGFRLREARMIDCLTRKDDAIIATGGGAVLRQENRQRIKSRGTVVFLDVNIDVQIERTSRNDSRPLLKNKNAREILLEMNRHRDPIYRACAHIHVSTSRQSHRRVVDKNPLQVDLGSRSYPIYIASGIIDDAELYRKHIRGTNVLIVCDDNTEKHYLAAMKSLLSDYQCLSVTLPAGEQHKTTDSVSRIYDVLMHNRFDRNSTLIALGGGVVGDICGFAAATFQRGVSFIQVPTTLLAQVDSSVGGKTGVNHPLGKNMIGAFHQPACVIADMNTLKSLPERELRAGMAEVIKYGLIDDAEFYHWVDDNLAELLSLDVEKLAYTVTRCCANKARIVAADEREAGQRALLNLGHTFGHAIETAAGYGNWLHGEAIAAGMCMAARFSADSGHLAENVVQSIKETFERTGLPIAPPADMTSEQFIELMYRDKKVRDNVLTLVLMNDVGASFLSSTFDPERLRQTLYQTLNK